jgi:predicted RNA-binding Zn ribbon-like protein
VTATARRLAPGDLAVVQQFVNTRDIEAGTDQLSDTRALRRWLEEHGLWQNGGAVAESDLPFALAVREALRDLLVANAAARPPSGGAVDVLNRAAADAKLASRLSGAGDVVIQPDGAGVRRALGALIAVVHEAMARGEWIRMKACLEDSCHWAFYDTSRNHSSRWCSMGVCGNRRKNRAYYARRRERRED